jgi:hypothetical protein
MYQEMKEAMEKLMEKPPLTFSCDDEEITVPLVGHLQARPGEVVLPFDNYLAYRCPVTHRTRKVVSGIYTLEHVIYNKLIRECTLVIRTVTMKLIHASKKNCKNLRSD